MEVYVKDQRMVRLLLGVSLLALSAGMLSAQAQAQNDNNTLETVVVTGMRETLQSAINFKRNSTEVVDSIIAEDIGKLPDANVAETLTRIPGIQGYRFGGEGASPVGLGSGLTIRGLSSLTASRLDGRAYFTAGQREFNIEEANPGMIGGIDVFKNPTAEHVEGGIGGLVNVRTRRPFDFKGLSISAAVTEHYNDLVQTIEPEYFGLFSDRWSMGELGEMGFLLAANYQESHNRSDNNPSGAGMALRYPVSSTDTANYTAANGCNMTYAGVTGYTCLISKTTAQALAMTDTQKASLITTAGVSDPVNIEDIFRTRIGVNGAFQWKLNDKVELYAEGNYNYYLYHQNYRFLTISDTTTVQNLVTTAYTTTTGITSRDASNKTVAGQRFVSGTFIGDSMLSTGGNEDHPYKTMIVAGGAIWHPVDDLQAKIDISYVKADQSQDNRAVTMSPKAGLTWNVTRDMSSNPHKVTISGSDLSDPQNWYFNTYTNGTNQQWQDDARSVQLDFTYDVRNKPLLNTIKFGGRYFVQNEHYWNWSGTAKNLTTDGAALNASRSNGVSAAAYQGLLGTSATNWFENDAGYGGGFLTYIPNKTRGDIVRDTFSAAGIVANDALLENVVSRRVAQETTWAGYAIGEFSALGDKLTANAGVRVVYAEDKVTAMVANASGVGYMANTSATKRTDVLPSANITYHFTDELLMRLGYGAGLTRPDFAQLNPSIVVSPLSGTASLGNATLKPLTADSYDISLEQYFDNGGYISLSLWDKEIKGFITQVSDCETISAYGAYTGTQDAGCGTQATGTTSPQWYVTRYVNSGSGYARGVEVAGQTFFTFLPGIWKDFGISANWAYTDTVNPVQFVANGPVYDLPQLYQSKNSASVSLMYEHENLSARVVYTYRSSFTFGSYAANPESDRVVKGYGIVDASANYEIGYGMTLTGSVENILNEAPNRYIGDAGQYATMFERQHFLNGRVFSLGLRFKTGE